MAFEITVFLENKISHFEKITGILKKEKINIRSLTLSNINHGWGVLNMLVDQPEKAYEKLTGEGNSVVMREIIALEMKDQAGGLDDLLIQISRAGIHIESAYSRVISQNNLAVLILEVPDVIEATRKLVQKGITVLSDEMVYGN